MLPAHAFLLAKKPSKFWKVFRLHKHMAQKSLMTGTNDREQKNEKEETTIMTSVYFNLSCYNISIIKERKKEKENLNNKTKQQSTAAWNKDEDEINDNNNTNAMTNAQEDNQNKNTFIYTTTIL